MFLRMTMMQRAAMSLCLAAAALVWFGTCLESLAMEPQTQPTMSGSSLVLYVSLEGRGRYSGLLPEPNAGKTDGPLGALSEARDKIRELKNSGRLSGPVTVYLRGGRYQLDQTIVFGVDDSAPVTYTSYPGEQAVLDGGKRVTGWQTTQINGRDVWVADLPEVKSGRWYFRELFANGQRCPRARFPKNNEYFTAVGPAREYQVARTNMGSITNAFVCQPNQISDKWKNMADVDLVMLHFWCEERSPITSYDPTSNVVVMSRVPTQPIGDGKKYPQARFYVENVFEALSEPGEWYLDRPTGKLYYVPRAGEDPAKTEILAPRVTHLIQIAGKPAEQRYVEFITFKNLTFANGDWTQPTNMAHWMGLSNMLLAGGGQGASVLPGNIQFIGARACSIEDCRIQHMGWYAVELGEGCSGNRIVGNDMSDLGGGGVRINGSGPDKAAAERTGNNRITDNHIHVGGRIFPSACGVISMNSAGNTIAHNEIDDFYYTGISCGWVWGYGESVSHDNLIEKNHIHKIGQGLLGDMGAIYTLGNQSGTIIRGNLIHDVTHDAYGIYPDEGTTHLVVENNVCYDMSDVIFFQHFGRENIVRNNIFAFGGTGLVTLCKGADRNSFTFERNILITKGQPVYHGHYAIKLEEPRQFEADLNLIWDTEAATPVMGQNYKEDTRTFTLEQWHALGQDVHSIFVDPKFKDLGQRDFTLLPDSPALGLGFEPIDLSDVGPRAAGKRE